MSDFAVYVYHTHSRVPEELLYRAASRYSGLDPSVFKKVRTEGGKPAFLDIPHIKYSISHSGEYWVCAFGPSEVGLDLQEHKSFRFRDISNRFFNPEEIEHLERCDYAPEEFFRIWAAKESYVKFTGKGLAQGLATFSVLSPIDGAEIRHIPFKDGYSMCICAEKIGNVILHTEM